jgi:metal-responsive CopG/Arc/MetJ family transcriptional regulator
MKTAISLPDPLFKSAEALARRLGVSRSELFAKAVAEFIAQHDRARLTERLNAVYADVADEPPDLELAALQARSLPQDQW